MLRDGGKILAQLATMLAAGSEILSASFERSFRHFSIT
jgi:hypothetical protein